MNTKTGEISKFGLFVWSVILILIAGGGGYWLRAQRTCEAFGLSADSIPDLDYLIGPESFSRIKNAKNTLQGLCIQLLFQAENRRFAAEHLLAGTRTASWQTSNPHWESAIRDLERGMQEFEGTQQEAEVAQDLFSELKKAGRFDRCVELYLKVLYEHPTHPFVARFAKDAVGVGRLVGREEEVLAGLRHLSAIPLEFEGKDTVEAALIEAKPGDEFARLYARTPSPSQ